MDNDMNEEEKNMDNGMNKETNMDNDMNKEKTG